MCPTAKQITIDFNTLLSYKTTYNLTYTGLVASIHVQDLRCKVVLKSLLKASSFTWHSKIPTLLSTIRKKFSLTVQETTAPPNTFIQVESFSNPKRLADYFQYIDKNYVLYKSNFKWKGTGKVDMAYFLCSLCTMLHSNPPHKSYDNLL